MAISQSLPTTDPAFHLNFQGARRLDPRVTFSRASTATYVDEDGIVKTAEANQARFAYDPATGESLGLLIEESRTNLCDYSEQFDNGGAWGNHGAALITNATTAPDGTLSADKISDVNGVTSGFGLYDLSFPVGTSSTDFTYSMFAKAGEYNWIRLNLWSGDDPQVWFDLQNGVIGSNPFLGDKVKFAGIQYYGNGWYRCWVVRNSSTFLNGVTMSPRFGLALSAGGGAFLGVGGNGIFIWGAQLEAGSFPTSYIPTSNSQVTRSADTATFTSQEISTTGTLLSLGGGSPASPASYNSSEVVTSPTLSDPVIVLNSQLSDSSTIPTLLYYPEPISGDAIKAMRAYAPIVKSGLVLHLDAGVDKSYPNAGTIWRDLSGQGNHGTLVNGPTYDGGNGGSLVFDGTDDYVTTGFTRGTLGNYLTLTAWYKYTGPSGRTYSAIIGGKETNTEFFIGKNTENTNIGVQDGNYYSDFVTGSNAFDGNWHQIVYSYDNGTGKIYLDGILRNTNSFTKCNDAEEIIIGGETESGGYYFDGNISLVSFYNRVLTAAEVQQNFNASRSRFNI